MANVCEKDVRKALKGMKARCYFMGDIPDNASLTAYKLFEENLHAFFNGESKLDFSFEDKYEKVLFR